MLGATCLLTTFLWYRDPKEGSCIYRTAQITTMLGICMTYIATVVFWTLVAPDFLQELPPIWFLGLVLAHTLPLILILINYFTSAVEINWKEWWHSAVMLILYTLANFGFTEKTGHDVYPFMTWEFPAFAISENFYCWAGGLTACYITHLVRGYFKRR